MSADFDDKLKEYFAVKTGAYSEVTDREFYDSQLTLTGAEANIVKKYFDEKNIHIGGVKYNPELSSKQFLLYPELNEIHLNVVFPKKGKTELRLYLSKGFKPKAGDIFFLYIDKNARLVIGSFTKEIWKRISGDNDVQGDLFENVEDNIENSNSEDTLGLMEKPFDPTKINIETKTPSLDTLIKRIQRDNIQMDTSTYFQRKDDLWDEVKQSRLIESILIRFPLPAFYFDATNDEKWLVVDGLQRLSSMRNFCVTKTLKLNSLEFLTQLNDKYWDDLSSDLQRIIEETQVVLYKIMPGTPTDVKFNIFKRINTGGIRLSPQEIRHALFQGLPAEYVYKLANSKEFIEATLGKIPINRMADRDFINRFLAFYLLDYKNYQPDLDTFMSKAMANLYDKSDYKLNEIEEDFRGAMRLAISIFGREAFRRPSKYSERLTPVNKALFDALSTQFALLTPVNREILKTKKEDFKSAFMRLLEQDNYFVTSITSSTGDKKRINYRHKKIEEIISNIL